MKTIGHAIIMAAGRGQRMLPLTDHIPKAMASYDGSTLIVRGIEKIQKHIPNLHITVGYKKAMLAQHVIEQNVSTVFNTEGQGNAWWIYNTLIKHLNESVLVLTCDNIVELDIERLYKNYLKHGEPPCMVVPVQPVKGLEGDYIFHTNNLVQELSRIKTSNIYCSGIQIINPHKINMLTNPANDFYVLWSQLILQKKLCCSDIYPEKWFTVDTIEQLNQINNNT